MSIKNGSRAREEANDNSQSALLLGFGKLTSCLNCHVLPLRKNPLFRVPVEIPPNWRRQVLTSSPLPIPSQSDTSWVLPTQPQDPVLRSLCFRHGSHWAPTQSRNLLVPFLLAALRSCLKQLTLMEKSPCLTGEHVPACYLQQLGTFIRTSYPWPAFQLAPAL